MDLDQHHAPNSIKRIWDVHFPLLGKAKRVLGEKTMNGKEEEKKEEQERRK